MKQKPPFPFALSPFEGLLWLFSLAAITVSSLLLPSPDPLSVCTSLLGVTALIFVAKGRVWGQVLTLLFALLYGIVSYGARYYGEMLTYLGMTAPIACLSIISWLRHPYAGSREVEVAHMTVRKWGLLSLLTLLATAIFGLCLFLLDTPALVPSIVSITTSFLAASLTMLRSPWYAVAYAANDIVLIVLWSIASAKDPSASPMILCFSVFFINDLYGFWNWRRMRKRQRT